MFEVGLVGQEELGRGAGDPGQELAGPGQGAAVRQRVDDQVGAAPARQREALAIGPLGGCRGAGHVRDEDVGRPGAQVRHRVLVGHVRARVVLADEPARQVTNCQRCQTTTNAKRIVLAVLFKCLHFYF